MNLQILIAFISLLLPIFKIYTYLINSNKKNVKIDLLRKHIDFMNLYDKEYVNSIILEQYKSLMFYDFTGIYLSTERQKILIKKYKQFENYFTWKMYKSVFQYIKFNKDSIFIQFNKKFEYFFLGYLVFVVLYFWFFASPIFSNYQNPTDLVLAIVFFIIGCLVIIYIIIRLLKIDNIKILKKLLESEDNGSK